MPEIGILFLLMNKKNRRNQKLIFGSVRNYLLNQINPLLTLPYQITYKEKGQGHLVTCRDTRSSPWGCYRDRTRLCELPQG